MHNMNRVQKLVQKNMVLSIVVGYWVGCNHFFCWVIATCSLEVVGTSYHIAPWSLRFQVFVALSNLRCALGSWAHGAGHESKDSVPTWLQDKWEFLEEADQQVAPFHLPAVWHGSDLDSEIWLIGLFSALFCFWTFFFWFFRFSLMASSQLVGSQR